MKRREIFVILLFISVPVSFAQEIFEVPRTFDVSIEGEKEVYYYSGGNLIASQTNGLNYNYQDRLGSDVNSKTLPFGQEIISSERFSFTGKELDNELYYFGARYYDSNLGRFTAVDPMHETPYQYVGNNPLKYIDPTGMRSEEPGETTIRAYNIGISAAFPLIGGIYRGDPLKDILKNTAYGALTGLGSFEIKNMLVNRLKILLNF